MFTIYFLILFANIKCCISTSEVIEITFIA